MSRWMYAVVAVPALTAALVPEIATATASLSIEGSTTTPRIAFDPSTGVLEIAGRSIPENSVEFYQPLMEALDSYRNSPQTTTVVNVSLEYFNTASSKSILDVFKSLETVNLSGSQVTINWHYEENDEDMLEAGEDYQAIIGLPFKLIMVDQL